MKFGKLRTAVGSVVLQNDLPAGDWGLYDVSFNDSVICWDFMMPMVA